MTDIHFRTLALAGFVVAASFGIAQAETMKITADMKGSLETPPNDSKGTGLLVGTYDPATKKLTWDAHYDGLTGPATAAHFHGPAPAGKAAGVLIPIPTPINSPIRGEATLTEEQAKELTDGQTYFNVHTAKNPKGEIRGQVTVSK